MEKITENFIVEVSGRKVNKDNCGGCYYFTNVITDYDGNGKPVKRDVCFCKPSVLEIKCKHRGGSFEDRTEMKPSWKPVGLDKFGI